MKFFIPDASGDLEAEDVLKGVAAFVGAPVPPARQKDIQDVLFT